ncbi:MAG TPA: helix-turn-helix domain-containing protein, partial [Stellaceae bacterium]|nr:helix-turn-helix domain-containing protein [Stellaceae bacterium]
MIAFSHEHERRAVVTACRMIDTAEESPGLAALAAEAGMSRFHFHRLFKKVTGLTPKAYAAARRAERLRAGLAQSASVTRAIYEAGFNSSARFYENADEMLGMAPARFRQGGRGERIHFAVGQCSLGAILVAATAKGVCAIQLGDDPDALARALQDRFPKADLVGGEQGFERLVALVVGLIEAPKPGPDLPL